MLGYSQVLETEILHYLNTFRDDKSPHGQMLWELRNRAFANPTASYKADHLEYLRMAILLLTMDAGNGEHLYIAKVIQEAIVELENRPDV